MSHCGTSIGIEAYKLKRDCFTMKVQSTSRRPGKGFTETALNPIFLMYE